MSDINPVNQALITLLDNQASRTTAAFEGLGIESFDACPGKDCNAIRQIGEHLLKLRGFQLKLLHSPLKDKMPSADNITDMADLLARLDAATALVRQAIAEHDSADWYHVPEQPREGRWGDECTLSRLTRPFNDFTNHLGAIRAIRRILGEPAPNVQ